MTRDEHLEWAKKRALEYVDQGDPTTAVTSMISDMRKHPELGFRPDGGLAMTILTLRTGSDVRRWIQGFH